MFKTVAFMLLASLVGCSAPRIDNTRLQSADLVAMTDRMARSLLASEAVAGRDVNSEPWIITLDRVSNQTNDILPERERWAFMARLRSLLSDSPALRERNLRFVLPAAWARSLNLREAEVTADRLIPTHALAATFYSVTIANRELRSDAYLCTFQLLDLRNDQVVWEDRWEIKRAVVRDKFD